MMRYGRWCAAVLAALSAASPLQAETGSVEDLIGTWQLCGATRIYASDTNPQGVANAKLVFHADGTLAWRPADATAPVHAESGTYTRDADGIRLMSATGTVIGTLVDRGPDERVLSRDGGRALLLCRLGDVAAADRALQPRSIEFYRSMAFDNDDIARNVEARQPPPGALLGTWELSRVVVRDPSQAWFASNPYGWGSLRIAFDGRRMCFATLQPAASEIDRNCAPAEVRGLQVRADDDAGGALAPWLAGEVTITAAGVMRVPRKVYDEEFVWLGPDDQTGAPLEGRITLLSFPGEDD